MQTRTQTSRQVKRLPSFIISARRAICVVHRKCDECSRYRLTTYCLLCQGRWPAPYMHKTMYLCIQCLPTHHALHALTAAPLTDYADQCIRADLVWVTAEELYIQTHKAKKK